MYMICILNYPQCLLLETNLFAVISLTFTHDSIN